MKTWSLPLKPCPVRKEVGDNTIMLTGEDNGLEKQKLVMMPGWSMDSSVWKPVVAALSEYFQLIFCEWHGITGMEAILKGM